MIHDREIAHLIKKEELRQVEEICLIASENYVSDEVRHAQGSILTNKYAEGLPGKRYYGGCEIVDEIEELAIERARNLFSCEFANVQPHSGSQANAAVFAALAKTGDTIMGMSLATGGHLTHGSPVNFSGKLYNFVSYEANRYGSLEYSVIQQLAEECRPKVIVAGYSAYSRELDFERFREIADSVGAYLVVDMAHFAGFIAAGLMASPLEFAHVVTTTTHKTLRGPRGGLILSNAKDEKLYKKLNSSVFPGTQGGPLMHVIAAKAVALKEACSHDYRMYMFDVRANAKMSAEIFHQRGFKIVGGHNNVENHMFLVDFSEEDFTGADVEKWLGDVGIIVNKNMIRDDKRSAQETSGIRIGLAAVTTRGLSEYQIAEIMTTACDVIGARGKDTEKYKKHIREIAVNANTNAQ